MINQPTTEEERIGHAVDDAITDALASIQNALALCDEDKDGGFAALWFTDKADAESDMRNLLTEYATAQLGFNRVPRWATE